jgi:hypothetical protein
MESIIEILKPIGDFILRSDIEELCRKAHRILIEVALVVVLALGLWHILRALMNNERNPPKKTKGRNVN